ncbi:TPA: DUF6602 domain-containing protein [Salmonella enterica subsp. enterica]|uniref:DUF6602 domain-containing protein n=1 Tax=Salmonella enterica TaxID=28901 RepID=A0A765BRE1_SALER|nr:hypothetical protein [Salmonella enterica]EEC0687983.1 hypothetical protein [Salmonella enterica subsp. enterica serovar Bahrenfeld]EGK5349408.1 hypothetical protein [Salmonella enterica]EHE5993952.1 hypothetical protein [Salmonella enterica]HAG1883300.1 hypothetical protein [Salmonella enterica]
MLRAHFNNMEKILAAQGASVSIAGHSLHKGTPREEFISKFLKDHLPSNISIGTGEIIDHNSKPGDQRNQYDIVLYRNEYPKISFSESISAFLVESVICTIEIKSTLTYEELKKSIQSSHNAKTLNPSYEEIFSVSTFSRGLKSFLVAYNGPQQMQTVQGWIDKAHKELGISVPALPNNNTRFNIASPSLDAMIILEKGFVHYDNFIAGINTNDFRFGESTINWLCANSPDGNLLYLFHMLHHLIKSVQGRFLNPAPYISEQKFDVYMK